MGFRAGQCNSAIGEIRGETGWPECDGVFKRLDDLAGGVEPAPAHQRADHLCRLSVNGRLHIVDGIIGLAIRRHALRVVRIVAAVIPSPCRQVDSAEKRQICIHSHKLLVVGAKKRMTKVEGDSDPFVFKDTLFSEYLERFS
ncbi:hypothetical protein ASD03_18490 [Ensifer sp. Root127]|nr:hypothetical protein ASD03_18490 [Ensifer sp. Root127]